MTYSWHEDFFKSKVLPSICKDAGECSSLFAWLQEADRQLYDEILRLEQEIDRIWLAQGDRPKFKEACKAWYDANMQAIKKYQQTMIPEAVQVQKEPKQEKLI